LAYSAYGYVKNEKTHSYFTGYLQTKLENTKEAKELVQEIVNNFVKNGVTPEELKGAKNFLQGSEPLRSETFSQRQGTAFNLYYKNLNQDYPKKELEKIAKLSLKELNDFIKSHNEIKDLSFSIVTK
jgi:predicted Zn-dependent peptidase